MTRSTKTLRIASAAFSTTVLAGTAMVAGSGLASAANASGPSANLVVFSKFEARHSGQAMDAAGASTSNQAPVVQFPFHGGINQQWRKTFVTAGTRSNTGDFILVNRNSGMCLDVAGGFSTAASVPLVQAPCDGTLSQRWFTHKLADVGLLTGKGFRYHFNRNSGLVIDVGNASQAPGATMVQFPAKPLSQADNQLFNEGVGGVG